MVFFPSTSMLVVLGLVPVVAVLVVLGMAAVFWLAARRSLRRRRGSGQMLVIEEEEEDEPKQNEARTNTTTTNDKKNSCPPSTSKWPFERNGKASLQEVMADDIKGLSKEECLCLFRLLPPATPEQLHGEWQGEILAMGLSYPLAYLIFNWRLGRGWWLGKGVDMAKKQGCNLFYNQGAVTRSRRFDVFTGPSAYMGGENKEEEEHKDSLHMIYAAYNDGLFNRMHEELRCVNDGLFLGLGSLGGLKGRRPINSIPFLLVAPKTPVQPWDRERN